MVERILKRRTIVLIGVLAMLTRVPAIALAGPTGDPGNGHSLAREFCSSCHLVDREQRGPVPDGVPSFAAIAAASTASEDRLVAALLGPPHPSMPDPPLDRLQMRDVAAYIFSLRAS